MTDHAAPALPPLFAWREVSEIERLEGEIRALVERIGRLPPNSHARLNLQFRARQLRAEQLRLETELRGRS